MKVFLLGLDGARLDIIKRWAKKGKMPFMNEILKKGTVGNLKTIFPYHSLLAWPSLQTGVNPGKHGIYNTVLFDNSNYNHFVPNASDIKSSTLLDYLSEKYECCSINFPVTYPIQNKNMITISSWLTPPFSIYAYPKEIYEKGKEIGYKIQPSVVNKKENNFIEEVYDTTKKRFEMSEFIIENRKNDFFSLIITGTEHLHHNFASFIDSNHPNHSSNDEKTVEDYYSFLDRKIEQLFKKMDTNTNLIIVSDHGFAPSYGKIYLNKFLEKHGYLKRKKNKDILSLFFEKIEKSGLANKLRNKTNMDIFSFLLRPFENKIKEKRGIKIDADWKKTKAFCSGILGDIRINLKNKDETYEKLRNEIIDNLKSDPEISKFIKNIYKREKIYKGDQLKKIPDLFVEFKKQITSSPELRKNKLFSEKREMEGFHTKYGVFMAYGPDIKKGKIRADITDVAPTILYMFGEKIPEDMDGRVLKEIFKKDSEPGKRKVRYKKGRKRGKKEKTLSKKEQEEVRKRLKALGYLS